MLRPILIAAALLAVQPATFAQSTRGEGVQLDELRSTVKDLVTERRELILADELPDVPDAPDPLQVQPPATGTPLERTTRFVADYYASMTAYDVAMAKRISELADEELLSPETLSTPAKLERSFERLDELERLFADIERRQPGMLEHFVNGLRRIWAGQRNGVSFMEGVEIGMRQRDAMLGGLFAVRKDTITTFRGMLTLAREASPGLEDGALIFETDDQLERYRAYADQLETLVAREETVFKNMADAMKALADRMSDSKPGTRLQ